MLKGCGEMPDLRLPVYGRAEFKTHPRKTIRARSEPT